MYRSVEFYTAISDTLVHCVFLTFSVARWKVHLRQLAEFCTSYYILQICPDRISRVKGRKCRRQRTLVVAGGSSSCLARLSAHKRMRPCLNYSSLQSKTLSTLITLSFGGSVGLSDFHMEVVVLFWERTSIKRNRHWGWNKEEAKNYPQHILFGEISNTELQNIEQRIWPSCKMELYDAGDPACGLWGRQNQNPDICKVR
jgi:hypothetical protein